MHRYSISDLEKLSGITAHTIRIWERRYHLLKPLRTRTNIRYYTNDDLRKLLNVSVLSNHGLKISHISRYSKSQILEKVKQVMGDAESDASGYESYINSMMAAALEYDEEQFEKTWLSCMKRLDVYTIMTKIVYPMLNRVGVMWSIEKMNPAQEHFLSNLIERKLMVAIDDVVVKLKPNQRWLLFLHEEEDHVIPLLFAQYMLRARGIKAIYLGAKVPMENLRQAVKALTPSHLLTFISTQKPKLFFGSYMKELVALSTSSKIFLGGRKSLLPDGKLSNRIEWIDSVEDFERRISGTKKISQQKKRMRHER